MEEESLSTSLVVEKCKIHCNEPKKDECTFYLAKTCGLSQSFIGSYLFHRSVNCRKLIINANDSCSYTFQLVVRNAIDFCPVGRPILHIFVNSIQYSLFAYISVVEFSLNQF